MIGQIIARKEWRWQWVFPQENRWGNAATGGEGRHHADESILQRAFKRAVRKAGLVKRADLPYAATLIRDALA